MLDYDVSLRLKPLFKRLGRGVCPDSNKPLGPWHQDLIRDRSSIVCEGLHSEVGGCLGLENHHRVASTLLKHEPTHAQIQYGIRGVKVVAWWIR